MEIKIGLVGDGGTKWQGARIGERMSAWSAEPIDEQGERIKENLKEYEASAPYEFTMQEFEDIFEDRDPFEFL